MSARDFNSSTGNILHVLMKRVKTEIVFFSPMSYEQLLALNVEKKAINGKQKANILTSLKTSFSASNKMLVVSSFFFLSFFAFGFLK